MSDILNIYLSGVSINFIIILTGIIIFIFLYKKSVDEEDSIKMSIFITFLLLLSFIGTMVLLLITIISILLLSVKKTHKE